MVAKISYGCNPVGAYLYNENKVAEGEAVRLGDRNFANENIYFKSEVIKGMSSQSRVNDFTFHASINLHPDDKVLSDEEFILVADSYMEELGYKDIPYSIYRHNDTAHQHVHIIASRVDDNNKLVNTQFEFSKSKKITTALETKYQLSNAPILKQRNGNLQVSADGTMEYKQGVKASIAKVLKEVKDTVNFTTLTEFKEVLEVYNIRVAEVNKTEGVKGLVYILNKHGQEQKPIKASDIYHSSVYTTISSIADRNQNKKIDISKIKERFSSFINSYEKLSQAKSDYVGKPFVPLFSKHKDGTIYGVSFFDKETKSIVKASTLIDNYTKEDIPVIFGENLKYKEAYFNDKLIRESYFTMRKLSFEITPKESAFIKQINSSELCSHILESQAVKITDYSPTFLSSLQLSCENFLQERVKNVAALETKEAINTIIKENVCTIYNQVRVLPVPEKTKLQLIRNLVATKLPENNYLRSLLLKEPGLLHTVDAAVNKIIINHIGTKELPLAEQVKNIANSKEFLVQEIAAITTDKKDLKTDIIDVYKNYIIQNFENISSDILFNYSVNNQLKNDTNKEQPQPFIEQVAGVSLPYKNHLENAALIFQLPQLIKDEFVKIKAEYKEKFGVHSFENILTDWDKISNRFFALSKPPNEAATILYGNRIKQTVFAEIARKDFALTEKEFINKYKPSFGNISDKELSYIKNTITVSTVKQTVTQTLNKDLISLHKKSSVLGQKPPFIRSAESFFDTIKSSKPYRASILASIQQQYPTSNLSVSQIEGYIDQYSKSLHLKLPNYSLDKFFDDTIQDMYSKFLKQSAIPIQAEGNALKQFAELLMKNPSHILSSQKCENFKKEIEAKYNIVVNVNGLNKRLTNRLMLFSRNRLAYLQSQFPTQANKLRQIEKALTKSGGYGNALGIKSNRDKDGDLER